MIKDDHHVAWKDRLGLNQQWMRDIIACSQAHSTSEYITLVDRFKNDIVNIKNGPNLYDMVNKEWKDRIVVDGVRSFEEWVLNNPQESKIEEECKDVQDRIRLNQAERLYHFIVQTLEDNGFGFYESNIEGDKVGLDD